MVGLYNVISFCLIVLCVWSPTKTVPNPTKSSRYTRQEKSSDELGLVRKEEIKTTDSKTPNTSENVVMGSSYNIRMGLLLPKGLHYLTTKMGFSTSAGAVTVALDRIRREQLLPGAIWNFKWKFDECEDHLATGLYVQWAERKDIDIMIGPPCSNSALVVAVLSKFYDIPMISWAATSTDLSNAQRFPTMSRTIGSAIRMGRALKEMLLYFNWKRIAMFYTDDGTTRRCHSITEGLRKTLLQANIVSILNTGIDRATANDDEIQKYLETMPTLARINVICLEHENDVRRFMLRARQMGLTNKDYVYIMPDFVRDNNRSELWLDYESNKNMDGRNEEAKEAFKPTMMIEMSLSGNEELHFFKKDVIRKVREWPFYYESNEPDEQYGSLYSPFLHDAVYLYALALNKTFRQGGTVRDTSWIINNTKNVQFLGVSGHVLLDDMAGREPNFAIRGFDKNMKMISLAEALMYKPDGKTINLLVPDRLLWETRDGVPPKDVPDCGFSNERCRVIAQSGIANFLSSIQGVSEMIATTTKTLLPV